MHAVVPMLPRSCCCGMLVGDPVSIRRRLLGCCPPPPAPASPGKIESAAPITPEAAFSRLGQVGAVSIRSMAAAGTIKRFPSLITGKMPLLA
jgi:hypothetical protein